MSDLLSALGVTDDNPLEVDPNKDFFVKKPEGEPVNKDFLSATTVAPNRDPLVLDLDGDGLETVGINTTNPILFDHNGDGVKTATGWVKSDDAFLVLDRNSNGSIDSGFELFGDSTPLAVGGTATDGFAALAQEDTNSDGIVDSLDARFSDLRLWRDLNQDGISQSSELFTLASQGIAALNVSKITNAQLLANGNQIADLGSFMRSNGSTGTLGAVEQLADINLASNPFYSQFTDSIPLTEAVQTLPDMQGTGMVRSQREAASLPTAQGIALATELAAFAAETTRNGQQARLDALLKAWADTSTMATTASGAFDGVNLTLSFASVTDGTPAWQAWLEKLSILERFNGRTFLPVPAAGTTLAIDFYSTREALLDSSYTALKESVYGALVVQTRLKPYLDTVNLSIDQNGFKLDYSMMVNALNNRYQTDPVQAFVDCLELKKYVSSSPSMSWDASGKLVEWVSDAAANGELDSLRTGLAQAFATNPSEIPDLKGGTSGNDSLIGGYGNDILVGMDGNDTITDAYGNDTIDGGAGGDVIVDQGDGTNVLRGGEGNDSITYSYYASNTIEGGAGGDLIKMDYPYYGSASYTNTFSGGVGNDRIESGASADTYLFNRGDGLDTINDANYYNGGEDTLVFGAGIAASDLIVSRFGSDLAIRITDPANPAVNDQITIENWETETSRIEHVQFADGTVWTTADLTNRSMTGTDEIDALVLWSDATHADGKGGDDTIDSGYSDATIYGGDGNDTITDAYGNDTI